MLPIVVVIGAPEPVVIVESRAEVVMALDDPEAPEPLAVPFRRFSIPLRRVRFIERHTVLEEPEPVAVLDPLPP